MLLLGTYPGKVTETVRHEPSYGLCNDKKNNNSSHELDQPWLGILSEEWFAGRFGHLRANHRVE